MQGPRVIRVSLTSRVLAALLGVAGLVLSSAAPASAASAWLLPPKPLTGAGVSTERARVGVDAAGDAVAVWERATNPSLDKFVVESARRPAGATDWSAPVTLSDPAKDAIDPDVAVDAAGDAVAVWLGSEGGGKFVVESASLSAGAASWSRAPALSELGVATQEPRVAVNGAGDAVAVWTSFPDPNNTNTTVIESASRSRGATTWSSPTSIFQPVPQHLALAPDVALDGAGDAVAVWQFANAAEDIVVQSATLPAASHTWSSPPQTLSDSSEDFIVPRVAVNRAGDAVAVWNSVTSNGALVVESASRPVNKGTWSAPLTIKGIFSSAPDVGIDGAGNAVAIWSRLHIDDEFIEAATLPANATAWSTSTELGKSEHVGEGQVTVDEAGDAVAVWSLTDPSGSSLEGANLTAGATAWSAPTKLSASAKEFGSAQVAADRSGDAVAVWQRPTDDSGNRFMVESSALDASSPQLRTVSAPQSGFVGQSLPFSASLFDFSAFKAGWSFGDGATADITSATHAYRKPGRYQAGLRATDTPGNQVNASAAVSIWQLALASPRAKLRHGKALVAVRCNGAGLCKGKLELRSTKPQASFGQGSFSLAAGRKATLSIKLPAQAKRLLAHTPGKAFSVKLRGAGVQSGSLRFPPRQPRRR